MVALSPATPEVASQTKDLRWKIGACLAAAWVLTQLWIASPLPYFLQEATGLDLIANNTRSRGLHFGFALGLAFVLFPSRWLKLPWPVDAALAVVAGISGSIIAWNYGHISLNPVNPGGFSLAVAFVGIAMLALATLRVFGWLGVILVALVVLAHFSPTLQSLPVPAKLQGLESLLNLHWFTTESVFGILLGLSTHFAFLFVMLGVGLDVMGCGRPLARFALRLLPRDVEREQLAERHPFARRFWALTSLLLVYSIVDDAGRERPGFTDYVETIVWALFFNALIYGIFLGFAWAASRIGKGRWRRAGLAIAVGGMLFGIAQLLALLLAFLIGDAFYGLGVSLRGFGGPAGWLLISLLVSFAVTYFAWSSVASAKRKGWLTVLIALPFVVMFLEMSFERISPGLSAFYAVVMMLFVLAECYAVTRRDTAVPPTTESGSFWSLCLHPLSNGTARVMLRVAILAALYGMAIPWALFWASYFLS